MTRPTNLHSSLHERGSVVVEFLFVFPAFLVLCLFTIELSLSWIDRHVARLAAFEAARVLAGVEIPEWDVNGIRYDDPCQAPEAMKRAKQAALRKIAIISPTVPLFLAKMNGIASSLNPGTLPAMPQGGGLAGAALRRVLLRWPTAAASTELDCGFDAAQQRLRVKLTYHRVPQTPFVDRVMYLMHRLAKANLLGKVSLDQNFTHLSFDRDATLAAEQTRQALKGALTDATGLQLSLSDAGALLKDVPGIDMIFADVTPAPVDLSPTLQQVESKTMLALDNMSGVLTGLASLVPESLRRIPMSVELEMQRDGIPEPRWRGTMRGAAELANDGDGYREWAKRMSTRRTDMFSNSTPLGGL